jgi:hypothetical protein
MFQHWWFARSREQSRGLLEGKVLRATMAAAAVPRPGADAEAAAEALVAVGTAYGCGNVAEQAIRACVEAFVLEPHMRSKLMAMARGQNTNVGAFLELLRALCDGARRLGQPEAPLATTLTEVLANYLGWRRGSSAASRGSAALN